MSVRLSAAGLTWTNATRVVLDVLHSAKFPVCALDPACPQTQP